ncbi:MAG: nucleotidyl transferase AbiEii/AbiGii toxin family protein [archaeon]
MDEIKNLSVKEFNDLKLNQSFNDLLLAKDYYLTLALYLLKDIEGIYFKGGTAIQKILFNHSRLSEDLDFTLTKNIDKVKEQIIKVLKESNYFEKIEKDKDVKGFSRLVVHYSGFSNEKGVIFIDLNKRAKLSVKPEKHEIKHFYKGFIPKFRISTLALKEMIAEKMAATIGRNKPRDHYDLYKIIQAEIPINLKLVKEKCKQSGVEFSIIKMFNKAKHLKNRWDTDLLPLISEEVSFQQVMTTISKQFKLKEEKAKKKKTKDLKKLL